jgi:hypothetical protein
VVCVQRVVPHTSRPEVGAALAAAPVAAAAHHDARLQAH